VALGAGASPVAQPSQQKGSNDITYERVQRLISTGIVEPVAIEEGYDPVWVHGVNNGREERDDRWPMFYGMESRVMERDL